MIRVAESNSRKKLNKTFMYLFGWKSPRFEAAAHVVEIPFAHNTLKDFVQVNGENQPVELANLMHQAWVKFIKDGETGWAQYDVEKRSTFYFDEVSRMIEDPKPLLTKYWEGKKIRTELV